MKALCIAVGVSILLLSACNDSSSPGKGGGENTAVARSTLNTCVTIERGVFGTVGDAEIRSDKPDTNYGDANDMQVGVPQGKDIRRSLLYFDVSFIPQGTQIASATVKLDGGNSAFGTIEVHNVLAHWSENTVTWNNFGNAFTPQAQTTFTEAAFSAGKTSFDATPLVQAWVNGTVNYGMILIKAAESDVSVANFKTSEHPAHPQI